MASTKEYLDFIMGQLSNLEEITYRAMMKEYILYYRGKIVGGIYDDRLLVKPVETAIRYMSKVLELLQKTYVAVCLNKFHFHLLPYPPKRQPRHRVAIG